MKRKRVDSLKSFPPSNEHSDNLLFSDVFRAVGPQILKCTAYL